MPLRTSPLDAAHRSLGARMAPFAGWEMPLSYPDGTLAEHRACREHAVAFDVSHLGTVHVGGPRAFEVLNATLTNDLARIGPGRAQYTHLLDENDASVVDDLIVWWVDEHVFHVMPNASNTERVIDAVQAPDVDVEDITGSRAVIAVQGPAARSHLGRLSRDAARVDHFGVAAFEWRGLPCLVAGTGYTGEDGIEIAVPVEGAQTLWSAILGTGVAAAGLGARDTLRLEAGLPLHGHELGPGITPLQAGLGWVVAWGKATFRGRHALEAERQRGLARRLRGLATEGRQPPREHSTVLGPGGEEIGVVTSGNFSPVLGHGIAFAFVPPEVALGDELLVEARGRSLRARVVKTPFVTKAP